MPRIKLLIPAIAGLAIAALPLHFDAAAPFGLGDTAAYAKNDKGGGDDKGGGNGKGGSNANGGGKSDHAKSDKAGKSAANGGGGKGSSGKLLRSLFSGGSKDKSATRAASRSKSKVKSKSVDVAALPATMEAPALLPAVKKEKNLNAKLAGLNSLNRNFHAYLNSNSPRMAAIQEFVMASVDQEEALATLAERQAELTTAGQNFNALLTVSLEIDPFGDTTAYDDPTIESLTTRRDDLLDIKNDPLQWDALTGEEQAVVNAEIGDLDIALASDEAAALGVAQGAVDQAQETVDAGADAVSDEALEAALLAAANKNRVEQYGDDYIDDEILEWAKDVLGVGDAEGKIDEISDFLAGSEE